MAIEIRPPRERELESVADLVAAGYGGSVLTGWGGQYDLRDLACLVAVFRHTPVGALHYRIVPPVGEIWGIVAVPKRRGTGRALVGAAREVLGAQGVHRLVAPAGPNDAVAGAFWRACGFAEGAWRHDSAPGERCGYVLETEAR